MSAIWAGCGGERCIEPIEGTLCRMVESQEQVATTEIVETLDEQAALEEMLEASKPPLPTAGPRHYLLRTPFRYPPLRHGSRFGRRFEPSLFYASLAQPPMLAEAAFYRFVFWFGMATPPASTLTSQHTSFSARYRTARGVRLQAAPFDAYRTQLTDPADYGASQALGTAMRAAGVEAFEYVSARDPGRGLNVALFTPRALVSSRPLRTDRWVCRTGAARVQFLNETSRAVFDFAVESFLVDGRLPQAAA